MKIAAHLILVAWLAASVPAQADVLALSDLDLPDGGVHRGDVIPAAKLIRIPDGKQLDVIDDDGRVFHLFGSWEGRLDRPRGTFDLLALRLLLAPTGYAESPTPRGQNAEPPPTATLIDVTTPGHKCIAPDGGAMLWHPSSPNEFAFSLTRLSDHRGFHGRWGADATALAWPAPFRPQDGDVYDFADADGAVPVRFTLTLSWALGSTSIANAEALARAHCIEQAYVMLRRLADGDPDGGVR